MKLMTSIPPRRDGTVTVTAKDGTRCVFSPGPDGSLVGDVEDEATVAQLLNGGLFFPADPDDYDKALLMSNALATAAGADSAAGGVLLGSSSFDPVLEVGDKQVQLGDVVAAAYAASGMSVEEWNALTETERDDLIEAELDRMEGAADEKPAGGLPVEANTAPKDPAPAKTAKKK